MITYKKSIAHDIADTLFFIFDVLLIILFFLIHLKFFFLTLMKVPFIPSERDSMTPALSNLRNAFTITDLVIPTRSATLEAISKPSFPPNSSKICSIASFSE